MTPIIEGGRSDPHEGHSAGLIITDFTITTAQVKALNGTAIAVLAAPGANLVHIIEGVMLHKPAGTAYDGIAAGEDMALRYTDSSGLIVATFEMTGFADSSGVQTRWGHTYRAASGISDITPVANAVVVAHMLTGDIATGTSDFLLRIFHRIVATVLN